MEPITSNSQRRARLRPGASADGADGPPPMDLGDNWLRYWLIFGRWWLPVFLATLFAAASTGVIAKFFLQKTYRATAILMPVSKQLGMPLGGGLAGAMSGGLAELIGGSFGGESEANAQEYISILGSFAFTTSLAERHREVANFALDANDGEPPDSKWKLYTLINDSFSSDYDFKTGNLSLFFVAKSREQAKQILEYYIDDLRDKLRTREVQNAALAVASLREEVNRTSDSLLQGQLYELVASQLQREKLAQVQADFAFSVIEPSVVPDRPYRPQVLVDCVLAAMLTLFVLTLAVLGFEGLSRIRYQVAMAARPPETAGYAPIPEQERSVVGRAPAVTRSTAD